MMDRPFSDKLSDGERVLLRDAREKLTLLAGEAGFTYAQLLPSQISMGNSARVADVMRRSLAGESIRIGILGDSIGEGAGASAADRSWAQRIRSYWNASFHPVGREGNADFVNASIGSNTLTHIVHRMGSDLLDRKPDIVFFSEWIFHDRTWDCRAFESILYRLLDSGCAVVAVIVTGENGANSTDDFTAVTAYYDIPTVSYAEAFDRAGFAFADYAVDTIHPNDRGYAGITAAIGLYLTSVLETLPEIPDEPYVMPAAPWQEKGRCFADADVYGFSHPYPGWTVDTGSGFASGSVRLSDFRTYNGWRGTAGGDPLVITVKGMENLSVLLCSGPDYGRCTVRIEDEAGRVLSESERDCSAGWVYAWPSGFLTDFDGRAVRITITPAGTVMVCGLMLS